MIINFDKKITDKIWLVKNFISEKEANSIINSVKIDQRNKNGTILIPKLNIINKMIIDMQKYLSNSKFLIKEVEYFNVMHWHSTGANGTRHADNDKDINPNCSYGCVLYLNDDYSGGELYYPEYDLYFKPQLGDMIFHESKLIHEIQTVTSGIRFAMNNNLSFYNLEKTPIK